MSKEKFLPAYEGSMRQDLMEMARRESGVVTPDIETLLPPRSAVQRSRPRNIGAGAKGSRGSGESRGRRRRPASERRTSGRSGASRRERSEGEYERLRSESFRSTGSKEAAAGILVAGVGAGIWASGAAVAYSSFLTGIGAIIASQAIPLVLVAGFAMIPGALGAAFWAFKKVVKTIAGRIPGVFFPRTVKYVVDLNSKLWLGMDKWAYSLSDTEGLSPFSLMLIPKAVPQAYLLWRNMNAVVSEALDGDAHSVALNIKSIWDPKKYYKEIIDQEDAALDKRGLWRRVADYFAGREDGPSESEETHTTSSVPTEIGAII